MNKSKFGATGASWADKFKNFKDKQKGPSFKDTRLYKPQADADTGKGEVLLRFLPVKDMEELPFVAFENHAFRGPNGWYIEKCPSTHRDEATGKKLPCPACSYYFSKVIKGNKDHNKQFNDYRAKPRFVFNIRVLNDKQNPENNGKTFLWDIGNQIFEKIEELINEGVFPWSLTEGRNFKLKIKMKSPTMPTYETSVFEDSATALENAASVMETVYDISDFGNIKTFAALSTRFNDVMNMAASPSVSSGVTTPGVGAELDDVSGDFLDDDATGDGSELFD